ncbi:MAG: hypothetical protein JWP89_6946 [Schlesneria sp.]|nr:hypothetical protein [Schlesneria sp.]
MLSIRICFVLALSLNSVGCVAFQDHEYCLAQKSRAHCAWWCCSEFRSSSNPISHYSCGWYRGYSDVLMGGDGRCPPVPPQNYWSHKYQSEAGSCAVECWFEGYRHGAAAALANCEDNLRNVPISGEYQQCSPDCLSNDRALHPFGRSILGVLSSSEEDSYSPPADPGPADVPPSPDNSSEPVNDTPLSPDAIPDGKAQQTRVWGVRSGGALMRWLQ